MKNVSSIQFLQTIYGFMFQDMEYGEEKKKSRDSIY